MKKAFLLRRNTTETRIVGESTGTNALFSFVCTSVQELAEAMSGRSLLSARLRESEQLGEQVPRGGHACPSARTLPSTGSVGSLKRCEICTTTPPRAGTLGWHSCLHPDKCARWLLRLRQQHRQL